MRRRPSRRGSSSCQPQLRHCNGNGDVSGLFGRPAFVHPPPPLYTKMKYNFRGIGWGSGAGQYNN
eukprot:scaffold47562_cov61-Cyclotella_meneghiniana.AAC.3